MADDPRLSRRPQGLLKISALFVAGACMAPASAATFGLDDVAAKASALATHPYKPPPKVSRLLRKLDYDQYRSISFRRKQALWPGNNFRVQFFSPGYLFKTSVKVNVIDNGQVHRVRYRTDMFNYGNTELNAKLPPDTGFAGFRLHYTANSPPGRANRPDVDEFIVFQGASYFRSKGIREPYGLSARGISVDTAGPGDPHYEQFPRFSEFWLVRPKPDAHAITVYALLNGRSLTGAYRFKIRPGEQNTTTMVKAVLFLRQPIAKLGLAPLTSMYMYSVGDHRPPAFLRPAVHDVSGLLLHARTGAWIWRPLHNPRTVREYTFSLTDPAGFGLIQRDRDFANYQSLSMQYEQRPSAWVTPLGNWGPGKIHLVELPTDVEWNDNISAFWVSNRAANPGKPWHLAYRIRWGKAEPDHEMARVSATRIADGQQPGTKVLYVDFTGRRINALGADAPLRAYTTVSGGRILGQRLRKIPNQHVWRLRLHVARTGRQAIQLRATLHKGGRNLSETWDYVVQPPPSKQ